MRVLVLVEIIRRLRLLEPVVPPGDQLVPREVLEEEALRETPLQRVGEPADVADVILFLCSPLARHVTGTVVRVDGGQCTGA